MGQLFALSLDWLNDERELDDRRHPALRQGQRALADRIVAETREVETLEQAAAPPTPPASTACARPRAWDTRVFTDRQRSLRLVCDQPVLLEQRAFALARIIQDSLQ